MLFIIIMCNDTTIITITTFRNWLDIEYNGNNYDNVFKDNINTISTK